MIENNQWVQKILENHNISLIGFADLSEINIELRHGFKYGICIAIALKIFPSITNEPSKAYYDEYNNVSKRLTLANDFLANSIKDKGFNVFSLSRVKQNEQFRTLLPYKTLATRAGLGWIGKSATLVTRKYGNAIRLRGVLTDMPFLTETPINESFCGECVKCVESCPGKAVLGSNWSLGLDRDILLNPFDCKNTVIDRGKIWNVTEGSCGICISVCPWTKKYIEKVEKENNCKIGQIIA